MRSFVKIALFAVVATNAIRISEEPTKADKVVKETTKEEIDVGKFAYKMAGPDTKSKAEQIQDAW